MVHVYGLMVHVYGQGFIQGEGMLGEGMLGGGGGQPPPPPPPTEDLWGDIPTNFY